MLEEQDALLLTKGLLKLVCPLVPQSNNKHEVNTKIQHEHVKQQVLMHHCPSKARWS